MENIKLTPTIRRMVRTAFVTKNAAKKRKILETIKLAGYSKEFLEAVSQQTFLHPKTQNQVKFVSLPSSAKAQVHKQWTHAQKEKTTSTPQKTPEPPSTSLGKYKDRKELRAPPTKSMEDKAEVNKETIRHLLPPNLDAQKKAQAKKQLENTTYGLLNTLRENTKFALENPDSDYAKALKDSGYTKQSLEKLHKSLTKAVIPALGKKYHPDVLKVANQYDLESEDADELAKFKKDKPSYGRKLDPQQLFQKFLAHAKPETKERMKGMSLDDFMVMYKSILAEDEEDELTPPSKKANQLPKDPHSAIQDAFEEGILAEDASGEEPSQDNGHRVSLVKNVTIFDAPSMVKKEASENRTLLRIASTTANAALRRELLDLLRK